MLFLRVPCVCGVGPGVADTLPEEHIAVRGKPQVLSPSKSKSEEKELATEVPFRRNDGGSVGIITRANTGFLQQQRMEVGFRAYASKPLD